MIKWIKAMKEKRKRKKDYIRFLKEHARLMKEDEEYKALLLLQNSICNKHHG